jgi:SNF2 family DNA or RNA helicase
MFYNVLSCSGTLIPPVLPKGGILADEMGLGKTLQMIALCMADSTQAEAEAFGKDSGKAGGAAAAKPAACTRASQVPVVAGTLIVCPMALIDMWHHQILDHVQDVKDSDVVLYHGTHRGREGDGFSKARWVITSFTLLGSEWKRREASEHHPSPLFRYQWRRVVLDEAHAIRNAETQIAKGACAVKATCRWALTGTPIVNQVRQLAALHMEWYIDSAG